MALDPLATVDDLTARLGRDLTAVEAIRAEPLLADVSAAARGIAGQDFTEGESTIRLRSSSGRVRLPQRPVTAVTAVTDLDGGDVEYLWELGDHLTAGAFGSVLEITYEHGYAEVPADVVGVVCQVVGRALGRAADDTTMTSESIGGYSYALQALGGADVGTAVASGPFGFLDAELAVLNRYRRVDIGVARMDLSI